MATPLHKTVARVTRGFYPAIYTKPHQIVVSLEPGDIIRFRAFRCKTSWDLTVDGAFRHAVALKALHEMADKRNKRKGEL